jgi:hypothetical protein
MFSTKTKKQPEKQTGPEWFTLKLMAAAFAMSAAGFHKQIRPLVPEADIKEPGKRGETRIRCRAAIDAYAARKVEQVASKPDPLLAGGNSEALERYREAKADMAEMERDAQRGQLVPRHQLEPAFTAYAAAVRRAGEALQRQYGPGAADMLNEALDDAERAMQAAITAEVKA